MKDPLRLEEKLQRFFASHAAVPDAEQKKQLRERLKNRFRDDHPSPKTWEGFFLRTTFFRRPSVALASLVVLGGSFGLLGVFDQNESIAGSIEPRGGVVEIVRDGRTLLVREGMDIKPGDIVRIGNKSEAKVVLRDGVISLAGDRTEFSIADGNTLTLKQGQLISRSATKTTVHTERGKVVSTPGADFLVEVSESGETRVVPEREVVFVYDTKDGSVSLTPGEEISLRSDTRLQALELPKDIGLSASQIRAIESKLIIARSKLLTGVEKSIAGKSSAARRDFESAQDSFVSIDQVLHSSRSLQPVSRRNVDMLDLQDIVVQVKEKTDHTNILADMDAVVALFELVQERHGQFGFAYTPTGVPSFDRYVLLSRVLSLATEDQYARADRLLQGYTVSFLRSVQNHALPIDQIAALEEYISLMPGSMEAEKFLLAVQERMDPELAELLGQRMQTMFPVI